MLRGATVAAALLAASSVAAAQPMMRGETPGHTCQRAGSERFIGKTRTTRTAARIKRTSHAAMLRWVLPGHAVTMDYRADRATVWIGPNHRITRISCS